MFHLSGVIKLAEPSGDGNTAGIIGSPDHRIKFILRGRFKPVNEVSWRSGRRLVADCSYVFVNQRRVYKRIFPRQMPRDIISSNGGGLDDLQAEAAILPGRRAT